MNKTIDPVTLPKHPTSYIEIVNAEKKRYMERLDDMKKTIDSAIPPKHPASYIEIVNVQKKHFTERLNELKRARKAIESIEGDLEQLVKSGRIYLGTNMYLVNVRSPDDHSARAKWALSIDTGWLHNLAERLARGLVDLGWTVTSVIPIVSGMSYLVFSKPGIRTPLRVNAPTSYIADIAQRKTVG